MHAIHELREMLCGELEEYGKKDSLSMEDLKMVDTLAHATKNLDKILEADEGGYSGRYYDVDYSGRRGRPTNARRDSMGRYSSMKDPMMINNLRQMMDQAQDERTRKEFENFIQKIETM